MQQIECGSRLFGHERGAIDSMASRRGKVRGDQQMFKIGHALAPHLFGCQTLSQS